ncbi:MAG TPA: NADH-quinone oxidoreductase subunit NuoH [Candidatus Nitrosotenuis sp.]|nr:NADH-quinone oxidoreductase subunit NuoH [Candidatus Nitrosotenuis sp.]
MDQLIIGLVKDLSGGRVDLPQAAAMLAALVLILAFISVNALFLIWLERKVSARIQNRVGPMMTGPRFLANLSMWTGGVFQTVMDALKLLAKEDVIPAKADRFPFVLAPVLVFTVCLAAFVVIPFGPGAAVADLNIGLLYVVAIPSLTVLSIVMAGWSSNNKYSLLGGLRSAAQMLSYEIPLLFALMGPMMLAGTLSMQGLVRAQDQSVWFVVPSFMGAIIYYVCAIAEVNRPPFDIPEAESELVAGYVSEYSGMKFAMFFLAEFSMMWVGSAVFATVFLGGWLVPFVPWQTIQTWFPQGHVLIGIIVFLTKVYIMVFIMMWIRWTFPRVRPDHLMSLGWKVLLPGAFLNLLVCAVIAMIWQVSRGPAALAASLLNIATCLAVLVAVHVRSTGQRRLGEGVGSAP